MDFCTRQMATRTKSNKRTKDPKWSRIAYFLPVVLALVIFLLLRKACNEPKSDAPFASYNAFHIKIPKGYTIHGIDVSYFQEDLPWSILKQANEKNTKIGFVFIKATEGITRQDKMFKTNWSNAKKAGIPHGAYHYFIASRDGEKQAQNFIQNVFLEVGDLPPVLDIEHVQNTSKEQMRKEAKTWLKTIEAHYGIKPIIYTNIAFYRDCLGSDFDGYPLWIAHYQKHTFPKINRSWLFWQHDEQGQIKGIRSKLDFNVFNGDSSDFRNILIR
ncbi:glycoside hydrolase family 25 protein [Polluticoccus soli]